MRQKISTLAVATAALFLTTCLLFISSSFANPIIPVSTTLQPAFTPAAPTINAKAYILIDANSGRVIVEKNADDRMPPASLTKLMSLYIISSAIKSGAIHWDDKVRISTKAWQAEGSRMFVKVNDDVPVKDLVQGIAVASGNDATIAMAEHIASAEDAFASMMNEQAKQLGMNNSHFTDSTGLPDPTHYSSPRDFATLAQAYIKNFPEDYHFFSEKWISYNGIRQPNRNRLLWRYPYADGLKTGHTDDAGYCLISSATKDGMRLISVIMGAPSEQVRTEESIRLLNYGFRFYHTHKLYGANQAINQARVWKGASKEVPVGLAEDLFITVSASQSKNVQTNLLIDSPLKAPIVKGQTYGSLNVMLNDKVLASKPVIALADNPRGPFWRNITDSISYGIHKIFSKSKEPLNNG
jgi:D-alanyl-D-alanine carboxypeptidase (penicillin-binding protein 5/6)